MGVCRGSPNFSQILNQFPHWTQIGGPERWDLEVQRGMGPPPLGGRGMGTTLIAQLLFFWGTTGLFGGTARLQPGSTLGVMPTPQCLSDGGRVHISAFKHFLRGPTWPHGSPECLKESRVKPKTRGTVSGPAPAPCFLPPSLWLPTPHCLALSSSSVSAHRFPGFPDPSRKISVLPGDPLILSEQLERSLEGPGR